MSTSLAYLTFRCLQREFCHVDDKISFSSFYDRLTLAEVEASYNSIEVAYLFMNRNVYLNESEDSDIPEIKLAHIIADAWADRLKRLYPARVFKVPVLTPEESGSVHSVEFYEIR